MIIPITAKLLKFTSKVISKKGMYYNYRHFLNWVFYSIYTSLCNEQYSSGYYESIIYNEIDQSLDIIATKLNISIDEISQRFL